MTINAVFRADASIDIGSGHVMRCLALADELRQNDANISFICREEKGNLIELLEKKEYFVHRLPCKINWETDRTLTQKVLEEQSIQTDWLIIDHYDIDISWESSLRKYVERIMVIDDFVDRQHDCDLFLNQNYGVIEGQYHELLPERCLQLLGPDYALLRPEFRKIRDNMRERNGEIKRILLFMGGADTTNETSKALRAIRMLKRPDIATDVVVGQSNLHRDEVEALTAETPNITYHFQVENMAELMDAADLSIGAGGSTTWERCCVGLPGIVITIADNQVEIAKQLARDGYIVYAGYAQDVSDKNLFEDLSFLLKHPEIIMQFYNKMRDIVDGRGVKRVGNYLSHNFKPILLRPAVPDDCPRIFEWRNHPDTRRFSFDMLPIPWDEHEQWFLNALSSHGITLLIGEVDNNPVGVLRYNFKDEKAFVSIYLIPGFSGRGYGTCMLKRGNDWIKEKHSEVKTITAEIKHQNHSSIKAFQRAGFRESHSTFFFGL